jgi:hypothetical protein
LSGYNISSCSREPVLLVASGADQMRDELFNALPAHLSEQGSKKHVNEYSIQEDAFWHLMCRTAVSSKLCTVQSQDSSYALAAAGKAVY